MPSQPTSQSDPTRAILEWLANAPASDLSDETGTLLTQLDALHSPTVSAGQFHSCMELFYGRALALGIAHRHAARELTHPLPDAVLARARLLGDGLRRVASGFERVLTDADSRAGTPQKRFNEATSARALRMLGEHFLTMSQAGMEPDPDIWRTAYRLYALSRVDNGSLEPAASPSETALLAYKRLLGMVALEPLSLTPAELEWSADYLTRICAQLHVQEIRPTVMDSSWYWLDPQGNAEPQACVRREAPEGRSLLFFSTTGLARHAGELLARHEDGHESGELARTPEFPGVRPVALLDRLRQHWSLPPRRELPRRRQDYKVEACVGLSTIWNVLRNGVAHDPTLVSHWTVLNESPGGFAIMHLQGHTDGLAAGMAVALRRNPADAWNLCVVRWLRSELANQMEVGLQVVSRSPIPVLVGFRGGSRESRMSMALVLPVLPALRQHQAVMAPAGTYVSRRFTLVSDVDRVYIAQCRLLSLDLQTSNVEIFQFEVDPYPL
ncbi:MAG: hypothetical protein CGU28_00350 [Candidatus Dactylopiibacterium carminicum]|uniref:GTPase n=1 Tax=Candidatus Dactylopiibacterium carminicum TaxID=857335 RepID=A0A272EZ14_9RHOO|nr:hypothetical protein [Candidatus Dactylopiibacterium carminicum]KAF7600852.1 hypothetical protein BGI27_00425 [Candidatus Dactylopiibacterium carminicum]PAS95351.1 MAG: hypothetical protein CGU29_00460 [Candidatus Dactylopiibacterium carminicum]PAS98638.1 MAG: hypothetical protein CGU28_00350 [Candidatus Dactylopiibacterium carminicum]PAT00855.1 MAG: hypothetical protein BSR46_00425 [Candidatus Dactylopiibacterium carminicum]